MTGTSDLLTLRELLGFLRISRATAYRLLAQGIPCIGRGRLRRFPRDAVLAWWRREPETERDTPAPPSQSPMHGASAAPPAAPPGLYRCSRCGATGAVRGPLRAPRCPRCEGVPHEVVRVGGLPGAG